MKIGNFDIEESTMVIAEVGSNHIGDRELAKKTAIAAAESGADAVKFQMYQAEKLIDGKTPVLKYIAQTHKTQRERFKSLQLPEEAFVELAETVRELGLIFITTPFYEEAVDFLDPLMPAFKIASGDLTNLRLIRKVVSKGKPILLATGFSPIEEIDWAASQIPKDQLILLHCVGSYPTPDEEVNLRSISFLRDRYDVPVGISDHSDGILAPTAAVALGAQVVEKHFILSKDIPAADVKLSIDPSELRGLVENTRRVERMRGQHGRPFQESEAYFRKNLRRSIYTTREVPSGTTITEDMMIPLRPWKQEAVPLQEIEDLVGKKTCRTVEAETPILIKDLA